MKVFDYEHVQLLPKKGVVASRLECDATVKFGKHKFKIPLVPANMKTIIDIDLAIELGMNGYFYIMHRFDINTKDFIKRCLQEKVISSISIGVKQEWYTIIEDLVKEKLIPDYITIDIAHGHSNVTKNMIDHIRKHMGNKTFLIAGNIATPEAVTDLERWGVDATKIGVGLGKVCITRLKTGFGTAGWQLSAIKLCAKAASKPIIADGGIMYPGDIIKSVRFGATMVMAGSILSAHVESPGKIIEKNKVQYKEYFGSASQFNKGNMKNVEGKKELVELKGSIWDTLKYIEQDIQSAISYSGGKHIDSLKYVSYVLLKSVEGY
ncbi:GMP reductase [Candidatus Mycoplasma mahonii]|uniref:GMP reductase n=1 Tax=Candidatus Mycoplasma mahonii TaxID=3004105 RepID=UPI0026ED15AD|nr:GMP reductase [Candidatus Mycoplasma mahonii]WKX02406.1 GMP reductase [Candidatus Mycoplasma mahonii]